MKTISDILALNIKGSVVALGTFDGVHLGHKKVITLAARYAAKKDLPCIIVTFDPHPKTVVNPLRKPLLLTTVKERAELAKELGAGMLAVVKFDKKLANTGYADFTNKYLAGIFKAKAVFIGYDYAFGRGREGNASKLKKMGAPLGFSVFSVPDKKLGGVPVKSTAIRALLKEGEFARALRLLGHPYIIEGTVIPGFGRGKELGYPTANIKTGREKLIPLSGVYAGTAIVSGKTFPCAVNIGSRPTFGANDMTIEAHLIGFARDITGEEITVSLKKRIRGEKRFASVKNLIKAIRSDVSLVIARSIATKPFHA
jgi:riboflavin kinase / FMN adenylyltransferase